MSSDKGYIDYYEIEDGEYVVVEVYTSDQALASQIVIKREAARDLSKGILRLIGNY